MEGNKTLSQSGKEVLIKAVAPAIPTYTMSCFKLPATFCNEIENMMAKSWWGQKQDENKVRWVSWSKMCEAKANGGMSFKELQIFNEALLAKQGWRIMTEEISLLHKVFKANYFPQTRFCDAKLGSSPSYVWKGIWEPKRNLLRGCRWRVGDEKAINIWSDYWLPCHRLLQDSNQRD
ncbi:uncharacterized mitochondrial protein AtMg00310-like [Carya illinoinensis]|uniref:uncharacterized mitochondrial protein AtMg00310-like n=1 Tax=Carya illinoinensis TaxID=32201 RepID=UPI001C71964F|nr:uncharacterized mitochondrial protein AtMg00310-like [Carya illinoinensis]